MLCFATSNAWFYLGIFVDKSKRKHCRQRDHKESCSYYLLLKSSFWKNWETENWSNISWYWLSRYECLVTWHLSVRWVLIDILNVFMVSNFLIYVVLFCLRCSYCFFIFIFFLHSLHPGSDCEITCFFCLVLGWTPWMKHCSLPRWK